MASILRGFRYPLGYFASFARSLTLNGNGNGRPLDGVALIQPSHCLCNTLTNNSFATATAVSSNNDSLERSLKRLDQDVKRSGRISRRDIEDVLEEIKSSRSATSSQSLMVIRCCGNLVPEELPEVRTALVQEIWKTLNNLNIPMDISHYNALLRVYIENEHDFSPSQFLAELEAKGVEPNRVTYQRLIVRYCQKGDIDGATKILEYMREKQLPVNENVFNALIMGHSQAGDMDSAAGILPMMQQAGISPSGDSYTTLMCGYAKEGNVAAIKSTLETCDKNEIYLLDKDILEVIYNLAINGHEEAVESLLERIRKSAGYNHDAINVILRLVNKGKEQTALKILHTMPRGVQQNGELNSTGAFMVRQMAKSGRPLEDIVKMSKYMEENGLNSRAILIATEAAVSSGYPGALELIKAMKELGHPVREHFFWPLIRSAKSKEEVLGVLRSMKEQFELTQVGETVRGYVIPSLKEKNYDNLIAQLRSAGLTASQAAASTVHKALLDSNLSEAVRVMTFYQIYYAPNLFRRPLLQALNKTKDLDAYILFLRHLYENLPRKESINRQQEEDDDDAEAAGEDHEPISTTNQAEVLGRIVYDAINYFKSNRAQMAHEILNGLVNQGLTLSSAQAARIEEKLGAEMTPEVSEMLGKLTTGELQPSPIERATRSRSSTEEMGIERLEQVIANYEAKGDDPKSLKRQLIVACIREKNATKLEEVISKLQNEGFILTPGVFAQIADMYASLGNLEKALEVIEKSKVKDPDFNLDRTKIIRIAQLFIDADRLDDCLKFLDANKRDELDLEGFNFNTTCWRLLNTVAEKGNAQGLQKLFDTLVAFKYIQPNNVLLGPLIKVHLVKDDLEGAMKTFQECVEKYKSTPWKNELASRLIQKEDAVNLQKLTDLSTGVHGEVNSLYDLVFSFIECGRVRQARKILETPGLRARHDRINIACEKYREEGLVQPLEGLIEATRDLNHFDRIDIYYNLLLSYIKEKQPEKALGLWTKLQEEDIAPSDEFLAKLRDFLQANNIKVPFVVSEVEVKPPRRKAAPEVATQTPKTETRTKRDAIPNIDPNVQELKRALRTGNLEAALAARQKIPIPSITDLSLLTEILIKAEQMNEAKKIVFEIVQRNALPVLRIFKFFLNRLSASGDVEAMEQLSSKLTDEQKRLISFDNRLCFTHVVSGGAEKYLTKLEKDLDAAKTPEEIQRVGSSFPVGGVLSILERHPELTPQYQKLAEKYAEKQLTSPVNALWMQYFIEGKTTEAETLWTKYLTNEGRLMFKRILHIAREKQDEGLIRRFLLKIQDTKVTEGALGNVYSCLIDVLVSQEKFSDGLKAIEEAKSKVGLENVNRTALQRVKEGVEKTGEKFPFTIPERSRTKAGQEHEENSSSSSSSSSDDEVQQKRHRE